MKEYGREHLENSKNKKNTKAESMRRFIQAEKEYIRHKQERAEFENTYRRLLRT
jgi:hypothetical protein